MLLRLGRELAKYAIHGYLLSLVQTGSLFVAVLIAAVLVSFGLPGLLLAIAASFIIGSLALGLVNTILCEFLWFKMKRAWGGVLVHGFMLGFALFIIGLPILFVLGFALGVSAEGFDFSSLLFSPAVVVSTDVIAALLFGYVGKRIAESWAVSLPTKAKAVSAPRVYVADNPDGLHCPRCGGVRLIVARDRSAYCIDCGRGIRKERFTGA